MKKLIVCFLALLIYQQPQAQVRGVVDDLEQLIKADRYSEAQRVLAERLPRLLTLPNADTLISYPKYLGKVGARLDGDETAIKTVQAFAEKVRSLNKPGNVVLRVYMEAAIFFSLKGKNALSYRTLEDVRIHLSAMVAASPADAALIESDLGVYAYRMGNAGLSGQHHRKATAILERLPEKNYERLYNSYNSMGTIMWFASKPDSGLYYFDKAIAALNKLPPSPENKYYRVGIVQNNKAQLFNEQGKASEAIHTMEEAINNYKLFLASKEPNPKKEFAAMRQYETVDNLARTYGQLGDLSRAEYLLNYSYRQKQKFLPANGPDIYKSLIGLGNVYFEQMNYRKAEQFLTDGLNMINAEATPSLMWAGEATNALSRTYESLGNTQLADRYYRMTDSLYELSYQGQYDDTYLGFLRNEALFYARQRNEARAVLLANKGYNYIVGVQGLETLSAFQQVLNLAEVEYELGNYPKAIEESGKALSIVNRRMETATQLIDSVKVELSKPTAVLLKTRSEYKLLAPGDIPGLRKLLAQLNEALAILDRRRAVIKDADDVNLELSHNKDLLDFTKEVQLKLFELTGDESMLDKVVDLHEGAIYTRIRSRLDKQRAVRFAEIPAAIQQQEEELLEAVSASLKTGRSDADGIQQYFRAETKWKNFQEKLRREYPRYYSMRYAEIKDKTVNELSRLVPEGVTAIRYFMIGKAFYALVADQNDYKWVPLEAAGCEDWIRSLAEQDANPAITGALCYNLYRALWQPLEKLIKTTRVIVIPDGPLYYLSFEMLTSQPAKTYPELVKSSLLNSFAISYHYSFFALGSKANHEKRDGNFAAFVPGFTDNVKKEYISSLQADSLRMDNEYLSLLPLPFSVDLARKMQGRLGGALFEGKQSTPSAFRQQAGNHSIIHIGTHAEANNLHPEFSRLIFAKDPVNATDSNSVFLYDIYNYDLGSELTVLTACETGRPGLNDGEGMISMAHAFSYAGSESILTGLWKIDEKASCIITDNFYKNLQQGMTKDVALQQAKLAYLSGARGRTLAPQYWAGLVIMGDSSPVSLEKSITWWMWALPLAVLVACIIIFLFQRKSKRANTF